MIDTGAALRGHDVVVHAKGKAGRRAISKHADQLTVRRQRRALMMIMIKEESEQRASAGDTGARCAIREVRFRIARRKLDFRLRALTTCH
jgi:hypothetical protein